MNNLSTLQCSNCSGSLIDNETIVPHTGILVCPFCSTPHNVTRTIKLALNNKQSGFAVLLRDAFAGSFNLDDMGELIMTLNGMVDVEVNIENFPNKKTSMIRELIMFCQRHLITNELIDAAMLTNSKFALRLL